MGHLELELLSALADGELDLSAARNAQAHLAECGSCAAQLAAFGRLDRALAAPAPVTCASALELRSALLDRELSAGEEAVVRSHLASCEGCRSEQAGWLAAEAAIRAMPAAHPSAATDARIAKLTAPGTRRIPLAPTGISALAARGAVAAAVVLAILVGLLPTGAPDQAIVPTTEEAFVAAVQQTVLYSPTNTLYVLNQPAAAVDARDATTSALRTRIAVGGRPTALALNEAASLVLVLDAQQRSLVEIDAQRNAVISTTAIEGLGGTPTSVQIEPNTGRVIVAAIPDPPALGGPAPTPTLETAQRAPGIVAVLDPTTKKLETVTTVDVAPRVVVPDPSGKQTLLVSAGGTTVVDPSYKTLRTLPGGIGAAFGARGVIAVLAADGPGAAVVYFSGDGAPGPLRLQGAPRAVASINDVGFAVLLGSGSGNGRIVVVDETGRTVATLPAAPSARDLAFDPLARRLIVAGGGEVASTELPATAVARPQATPEASLPASPRPSVTPSAAPAAAVSPSASAGPSAAPSAAPLVSAAPSAVAVALPTLPAGVPERAVRVEDGVYRLDLGGRMPVLTAATLTRIWFTDAKNALSSVDLATGAVLTFASFPRDAEITALAVGTNTVYAADGKHGRLFTLDLRTERLSTRVLPLFQGDVSLTVAPDGRLWAGMSESAQLISLDPVSLRIEAIDTKLSGLAAVSIDSNARVWFTDGQRTAGSYDLRNGRLTHIRLPARGTARALLPDPSGTMWVGTTAGEIFSIAGDAASLAVMTGRPIARLTTDTLGVAWYLTPSALAPGSYLVAPVASGEGRSLAAPLTSLDFSLARAAWLAEASGAFYILAGAAR